MCNHPMPCAGRWRIRLPVRGLLALACLFALLAGGCQDRSVSATAADPIREAKLRTIFDIDRRSDMGGVPVLLAALADADRELRIAASGRLAFIHDQTCVGPLTRALQDAEQLVRRHAIYALQRMGTRDRTAVEGVIAALRDPVMEVRYEAAMSLGFIGGGQAVQPLLEALDDASLIVANEAIKALARIGEKTALPKVLAVMDSERWQTVDVWARIDCLRGFKDVFKDASAVPVLRKLAGSVDGKGRPTAMACNASHLLVTEYGDMTAVPMLRSFLKMDDYGMQMACFALGMARDDEAIPDIAAIIAKSRFPTCRRMAMDALLKMDGAKTAAVFEQLLDERDPYIRTRAERALGRTTAVAVPQPPPAVDAPPAYADRHLQVDLAASCNQGLDVALVKAAAAGEGWRGTAAAPQRLADFVTGLVALRGIPFTIVRSGPAMLAVAGPGNGLGLPATLAVPLPAATGSALYLLHTAVNGEYGRPCGTYTVTYRDGTTQAIPLVVGEAIQDWTNVRDGGRCLVGWLGLNPATRQQIGATICEWVNPFPGKEMVSLELSVAEPQTTVALLGLTISQAEPLFAAVATGRKVGLAGQILLPEPVVATRDGRGVLRAELYDRRGEAVADARVTATINGQDFALAPDGQGYRTTVATAPTWTEMAYPVTVRAQKLGHDFSDAHGLYYAQGHPRLFAPPQGGPPPQFIVLGVDDCRSIEGVESMLDIVDGLRAKGAQVAYTMWCTPMIDRPTNQESLERIILLWQRLYDTGSEICNHTLNHNLNGVNWHARPTRAEQAREVEGNKEWLREHIHGLGPIFSFKGGGGGSGKPIDREFARSLLSDVEYEGRRGQHPDVQAWPFKLGDTWTIEIGALDGDAPPMRQDITNRIHSDYAGSFDFSVEAGVAMMKSNFDYHYGMPNRPVFAVNAFHDWGFKRGGDGSHRNQAAILQAFLEDVLVVNRQRYPDTYVITFHQLIRYMRGDDLPTIIAEGSGQARSSPAPASR